MLDAIETDQAAVNERYLIQRLNISMPFSPTHGEVRYDQPLVPITYKGMHLYGRTRRGYDEAFRQWYRFRLRGSLIKLANNGLHNQDGKDPFELLYALDDLITNLRINPFRTPLNGLELSITLETHHASQTCSSIVSYLNHPPNLNLIDRDGLRLPYAEVEAGQHTLKIYAPKQGALRIEIKIDKMQFLGPNRPLMLADLVQPCYAALFSKKLLAAFGKIIWKCPDLDLESLTPDERDLYLLGRVHDYWPVRGEDYPDQTDFKCVEKQRSRQREDYNNIVRRHWLSQPPAELERQMRQQLSYYSELMHIPLYQALLAICLERWHYVGNLPGGTKLPNRLRLPPLSEIYPLYLGRFPTSPNRPSHQLCWWEPTADFACTPIDQSIRPPRVLGKVCQLSNRSDQAREALIQQRYRKRVKERYRRYQHSIKKHMRLPGGLLYSTGTFERMLSAKARLALAIAKKNRIQP